MNIENAKQFPKLYYARHFLPGVVHYEDKGNLMVGRDVMSDMAPTAEGKPLYVHHRNVDMDNLHNAAGFMMDCFQHPYDGWFWSRVMITSDEGHEAVANGFKVSNAYHILGEDRTPGKHLNVPYASKVTKGSFTHMALTPSPRYEEAALFTPEQYRAYTAEAKARFEQLHNSKPEGKKMINFFKTKTTREAVTEVDADTQVELEGGKIVSVQEMINAVSATQKIPTPPLPTTKVKVGDSEMTVADLAAKYLELQNSGGANAGDESTNNDANGQGGEGDESKVPSGTPGATPKPDAQPGTTPTPSPTPAPGSADGAPVDGTPKPDHFKELSNANQQPLAPPANIESTTAQFQRGKDMFSIGTR